MRRRLDPRDQAELDTLMQKTNMWTGKSPARRVLLLFGCATPCALLGMGLMYLLTHNVWAVGAMAVAPYVLLLPYVIAPARFVEFGFRSWAVSDEDARKPKLGP